MNLETFSKVSPLLLGGVRGALLLSSIMIFRVFSRLLDPDKTWYSLNDRLCSKSPRKFGENNLFAIFPDEVHRVNIADLHDGNGGPVPKQWFNKLDGRNGSEHVYVGSAFAVLAGNIGLKNPSEADFLRSDAFVSLKSAINRLGLLVTDPQVAMNPLFDTKSQTIDERSVQSSQESPEESLAGEMKEARSPPKCSTPRRESPPKFFESPCSDTSLSFDSSTSSESSITQISLNASYAPAYKKRKLRQKVETVMRNVQASCLEQGEQLGDVIARSCLFKRKINIDGKEIISHAFSEVSRELGVKKAFDDLVPEELWNERVHMMSVPDWLLLLCKLESKISDDAWQMILNRTKLGKSGVSCALDEFHLLILIYMMC